SDREIARCLYGPAVPFLLATVCPVDLARMSVVDGSRTVLHGVQVILTREASDRCHLSAWRSFAPHVAALLDLARAALASGL
ncbi:MAG: sarcosine oxidase subunit gamma, partial [Mangrovicoccus sp.]|nr:sarcosine oxidase subunit gamma [Mangrovicoccus sp.]